MTTAIEKSLSRLAGKIASIEARLEAMQNATRSPSAFSGSGNENVSDLMIAAARDNIGAAAGRLRALHEGPEGAETKKNAFGKPAVQPVVIDGDFTEVRGE
ncbi:MAG: hypothetical protein QOF19_1934 [Alphaproteobacteria bacterium]|jgi:hypothetical protein|nr:hypothetical protein [Alphaproteobacteria bacterium]